MLAGDFLSPDDPYSYDRVLLQICYHLSALLRHLNVAEWPLAAPNQWPSLVVKMYCERWNLFFCICEWKTNLMQCLLKCTFASTFWGMSVRRWGSPQAAQWNTITHYLLLCSVRFVTHCDVKMLCPPQSSCLKRLDSTDLYLQVFSQIHQTLLLTPQRTGVLFLTLTLWNLHVAFKES